MRSSRAARALLKAAPVFAALGDETRLRVVLRLCEEGPQSITSLTQGSDVSRQAVTKHLRVLADAGLVSHDREGRETSWHIAHERLTEARRLLDQISSDWDTKLESLRSHLEND